MKKPYQIEAQRAVKQFEAMAADGNPAVQMVLPLAEMVGWLRKGVGELIRQAGLQLMERFHCEIRLNTRRRRSGLFDRFRGYAAMPNSSEMKVACAIASSFATHLARPF